jgi:hypothetical protein
MSIDQINLPITTIKAFYKKNLVISKESKVAEKEDMPKGFSVLGNNEKNIVIIVNEKDSLYLPDQELQFLTGILTACKLSLSDVAILNIQKNSTADYLSIHQILNPSVILMFQVNTDQISLPLTFPRYQIQQYNNQTYLCAPGLSTIEKDKSEKLKLWNALKQIFLIA